MFFISTLMNLIDLLIIYFVFRVANQRGRQEPSVQLMVTAVIPYSARLYPAIVQSAVYSTHPINMYPKNISMILTGTEVLVTRDEAFINVMTATTCSTVVLGSIVVAIALFKGNVDINCVKNGLGLSLLTSLVFSMLLYNKLFTHSRNAFEHNNNIIFGYFGVLVVTLSVIIIYAVSQNRDRQDGDQRTEWTQFRELLQFFICCNVLCIIVMYKTLHFSSVEMTFPFIDMTFCLRMLLFVACCLIPCAQSRARCRRNVPCQDPQLPSSQTQSDAQTPTAPRQEAPPLPPKQSFLASLPPTYEVINGPPAYDEGASATTVATHGSKDIKGITPVG